MKHPKPEEYVLYQGEKFQVEFYSDEKGNLPAKEYFDRADRQVKIKLLALVKYMAEYGRIFDETKYRIVDKREKIYEFKPIAERFFNFFYEGKKVISTNAYRKKTRKVDQRKLNRVIDLKKDYDFRVKGGVYYGQ